VLARLWMGAQRIAKWQALYSCQSTSPGVEQAGRSDGTFSRFPLPAMCSHSLL